MATTTARRSKNRKAAKPVSVTTTETVHLHTIAKEKHDEFLVSEIFSGNRLGKALAELEAREMTRAIPAWFQFQRCSMAHDLRNSKPNWD